MVTDISINKYLESHNLRDDLYLTRLGGRDCGLLKLRSGWLETRYWLPITEEKFIFLDFSQTLAPWRYEPYFEPAFDKKLDSDSGKFLENVFVLGGTSNYYHLLMDYLPRLIFLKLLPRLQDIPVVFDKTLSESNQNIISIALNQIGLAGTQILMPVPRNEVFRMHNSFVPSLIWPQTAVSIWEQYLKPTVQRQGPDRIFVIRKNVRRRELINQEEVAHNLQSLGFVSVDPANLTFKEQVQIFSNARIVIGVHGAGLTNLLFSPPGGHLIDLQTGPLQPFFRGLAQAKRFGYTALKGASNSDCPSHHDDFVIDVEELMATLNSILQDNAVN